MTFDRKQNDRHVTVGESQTAPKGSNFAPGGEWGGNGGGGGGCLSLSFTFFSKEVTGLLDVVVSASAFLVSV